jgi:hypothetical protein
LLKSIPYGLLKLAAITGAVVAIGFVVLQLTRSNATVERISVGGSSSQDSQEGNGSQVLSIISLLPKDAIRAILEPEFASPIAAETQMRNSEAVIGVSINGDARAYPINMLSRHEIVNDVVGGESIAVTW